MRTWFVLSLVSAALLLGCGRHEDEWQTYTGSPEGGVQPAAYKPGNAGALPPGDPNEKELRGCLSGANEVFTLTEERTGSVYRLLASKDQDAEEREQRESLDTREVFEWMKLNVGRMVAVSGERAGRRALGEPQFVVEKIQALADTCPANLMGAINEFNRPPATKVGFTQSWPTERPKGSMQQPRPPASVMPINPAH